MQKQITRRQLSVLILALMVTGIGQSQVFAILAPLGREIQLTELQITFIIALSALVFGLSSPHWGRFSDRVGRKPIIVVGLAGYAVGTLLFTSALYAGLTGLFGGALAYGLILVTRTGQSLIMSATNPACSAYAADQTERADRTRTMARLGTANSMGTILGPAVSGGLATFGLLAPLYFAAALAALACVCVWRLLPVIPASQRHPHEPVRNVRYTDRRIVLLLATGFGLFIGFSGIQQTLGFQLQDKLDLTGIQTAQLTGAALMVSASFTFLVQITVMQRLRLRPTVFIRLGLVAMLCGAGVISQFNSFDVLAVGMAFLGVGMALCMPAISAGASLAVEPEEQGGAAGLVSACPPLGFAVGPICSGYLYERDASLAPLFSASVFFLVLLMVVIGDRR
ncbi:MAG: MFS transporter [Pseudomonadota bacterium]